MYSITKVQTITKERIFSSSDENDIIYAYLKRIVTVKDNVKPGVH